MDTIIDSTSKIPLGVLRSKVSYYCMFLIDEFDFMTQRRYGKENVKNIKFMLDIDFIKDFLEILDEKRRIKFDGIPINTSRNRINTLYNDIKKNILHEEDDF